MCQSEFLVFPQSTTRCGVIGKLLLSTQCILLFSAARTHGGCKSLPKKAGLRWAGGTSAGPFCPELGTHQTELRQGQASSFHPSLPSVIPTPQPMPEIRAMEWNLSRQELKWTFVLSKLFTSSMLLQQGKLASTPVLPCRKNWSWMFLLTFKSSSSEDCEILWFSKTKLKYWVHIKLCRKTFRFLERREINLVLFKKKSKSNSKVKLWRPWADYITSHML